MAIVFVSPKRKQLSFFAMIASIFVLILIIIIFIVFLIKPKPISDTKVFKKPDIKINFLVLDSEELKNLNVLDPIEYQFKYTALTKLGEDVFGKITAVSEQEAKNKLEKNELTGIELEIEEIGRDNPFNIYYQSSIIKSKDKK